MRLLCGPQEPLFKELQEGAERHPGSRLQLAVAWVNQEGAALLQDVTAPMGTVDAVVGINNAGTTVEGLLGMLSLTRSLRVLYQHPFATFHPKAYCFDAEDGGTLIVGSSNLTGGGLDSNFEASLAVELTDDLREQWEDYWKTLQEDEFCFEVASEKAVEDLYRRGHLTPEKTARRRRRRDAASSAKPDGQGKAHEPLPTKPPTRRFRPVAPAIGVPFELAPEEPEEGPTGDHGMDPEAALPELFVRTLTSNDVLKLQGERKGTFGPDLTLGARDKHPDFWGWPHLFKRVVHQLPRRERVVQVRLFSNRTGSDGFRTELTIWLRPERPGHAAEFRFTPSEVKGNKALVPDEFDTGSLVVFERKGESYNLLLVTQEDARYAEYAALLKTKRPAHRYGYGTLP